MATPWSCASPSAWSQPSRPGTFRCTRSQPRWRRRWSRAAEFEDSGGTRACEDEAAEPQAAVGLPPSGGDTIWSNSKAAYEALSPAFREFLSGLDAVHDFARGFPTRGIVAKGAGEDKHAKAVAEHPPVLHPVIRTHPETGEDVPEGEEGELVITTYRKEGAPLIRYRTHDITRIIPGFCKCGSPYPRLDRIVGRSDDMIKVKGTNIYPAQVEAILAKIDGFSSEYRIILENEGLRDRMIIQAEAEAGADHEWLASELINECKSGIGIKIVPQIMVIGTLPRSEKKTKRVIDNRE